MSGRNKPSVATRQKYIAILNSRTRALTTNEIAHLMGVSNSAATAMLKSLQADRVVRCEVGARNLRVWSLTGEELPATPTSTQPGTIAPSRFSHQALAQALGDTDKTPSLPTSVKVYREGRLSAEAIATAAACLGGAV